MTETRLPRGTRGCPGADVLAADLVVADLEDHLAREVDPGQATGARRTFHEMGFVKVGFLAPATVKARVGADVEALIAEHGVRRDVTFAETGHTARRMRNVRRHEINQHSTVIPAVYGCAALRQAVSGVVGEDVLECPYEPEQYVITELSGGGDTHGWHWDDYRFALVWVIDCPLLADGGFVQCVPNTTWNKADPQLYRQFVSRPIYSMELLPGDLYVMRTDTGLHRVYPIRAGRRLIINMAYAAQDDLGKDISHETVDMLWADSSATPEGPR